MPPRINTFIDSKDLLDIEKSLISDSITVGSSVTLSDDSDENYKKVYAYNNNNNRRLVTLAEHTSDHGRQTNSSTEEKGEQV